MIIAIATAAAWQETPFPTSRVTRVKLSLHHRYTLVNWWRGWPPRGNAKAVRVRSVEKKHYCGAVNLEYLFELFDREKARPADPSDLSSKAEANVNIRQEDIPQFPI